MTELSGNQRSHAVRMYNSGRTIEQIAARMTVPKEHIERYLETRDGYPNKIISSKHVEKARDAMGRTKPSRYVGVSRDVPPTAEASKPVLIDPPHVMRSSGGISLARVSVLTKPTPED